MVFGINRIKRKAAQLREAKALAEASLPINQQSIPGTHSRESSVGCAEGLQRYVEHITGRPIVSINNLRILRAGDEAYPAMLQSIESAKESVYLLTYIFDKGVWSERFIDALEHAERRGVQVRVLVDALGFRYSFPSAYKQLKARKIPCRKFLPNIFPWDVAFLNLRNHRKLLIVDGQHCFTGGINIRDSHCRSLTPESRYTDDLHFQFTGDLVQQCAGVFLEDWEFAAKEKLNQSVKAVKSDSQPGETNQRPMGRVITDGPDIDFEKMRWVLLGAVTSAKVRIRIMNPYFLPDPSILNALCVAAMKGIDVKILVPEKTNIPLLSWASMYQYRQLLTRGCKIYQQIGVFDHSKVMTIDGTWSCVGSSNWDARSLDLNFEANIEVYDEIFARDLEAIFEMKVQRSKILTLKDLARIPHWQQIRNQAARLLSPYL